MHATTLVMSASGVLRQQPQAPPNRAKNSPLSRGRIQARSEGTTYLFARTPQRGSPPRAQGTALGTGRQSIASPEGAAYVYAARLRGESFERLKYATAEVLHLSPLPCWAHLPPGVYKQQVSALIEESEREAAAELKTRNLQPLGVSAVLRQQPHTRPSRAKKSPAPLIHAATKAMRQGFWVAYSAFVAAFRDAAELLKGGDRSARFPLGSFPPRLPFVSLYATGPP